MQRLIHSMDPYELITKYYKDNPPLHHVYVTHVEMVKEKALAVAQKVLHLNPDLQFIAEASLLHDIGIIYTHAPEIFCHGEFPYIAHGYLGRKLLEQEGLPRHALVAERHTGVGISQSVIQERVLPLPQRDMLPISLEEKIICFADKFYSKSPERLTEEKNIEEIKEGLARFGTREVERFEELIELFHYTS